MHEKYNQKWSIDHFAKISGLSSYRFIHKFKEIMGKSPMDYLITIRINKASELLIGTNNSIQTISSSVGYEDSLYFSKLFKKVKGISPLQYRKING